LHGRQVGREDKNGVTKVVAAMIRQEETLPDKSVPLNFVLRGSTNDILFEQKRNTFSRIEIEPRVNPNAIP